MKKLLVSTLAGMMLTSLLTGKVSAVTEDPTKATSEVTVHFVADPAPLKIVSVDNLDFGKDLPLAITGSKHKATADVTLNLLDNNYVGSGTGWTLTATFNGFSQAGASSLPGATISLATPSVSESEYGFVQPTGNAVILSATASTVAAVSRDTTATDGLGPWKLSWAADQVELSVPAGAASAGLHSGVITWDLQNGPSAN